MNFRIKNIEMPQRNKLRMQSLAQLLDQQPIILPEDSLDSNFLCKYSSQSSRNFKKDHHRRTFSHQENIRKTLDKKQSMKSNILQSLRKTWHLNKIDRVEEQVKLRTAGGSYQRYQSLELDKRKSIKLINNQKLMQKEPLANQNNEFAHKKQDTQQSAFIPKGRKQTHDFLRKGSSINRQVVVNILKLKMGKNSEKFDTENENSEIIKMIRLFKGYGQDLQIIPKLQKIQQSSLINAHGNPLKNRNLLERSIMGWGQEEEHYPHNLQISRQI